MPGATAVTMPVDETVDIPVFELSQEPPDVASARVSVAPPGQSGVAIAPVMAAGVVGPVTVIDLIALYEPQPFVTEYVIVSIPGATPPTTPAEETVVIAVLLLVQFITLPGVASVNVVVAPGQTVALPAIAATVPDVTTVTG